ncbi:DUF2637 domain-containing protein [Streptomyces sp. NRRL F-5123]|uniref:DUF2637 domain-containing protein n=1 Tax=Streptomyces sp. NRRL F-5123 TaxID=1463856 RepID=UPI0004E1F85C|nr:DUF2637 domain-containing protein [Streptomyces sp. NRRL F-5123]
MAAIRLTRTHRILVGVVVTGAVVIAGIGFAGSYAAVRSLALDKGFGWFANVFPIGVDAGIVVLLALDLLLTWLRIPFPLLRQTAWLLTAATIAFNGAAAWPDGLGVGMHAIIPVLFVVSVEAARHAIGRIADITADKHMEGVRFTRWLLAPFPTFRLWRRMKLWELRSYEEVIRREQDRLVYRARLRARYGVAWRRRAPVEAIMPLRLAKYGVPLADTAEAGLAAAGLDPLAGPAPKELTAAAPVPEKEAEAAPPQAATAAGAVPVAAVPERAEGAGAGAGPYAEPVGHAYDARFDPRYDPRFDPRYDQQYDPRLDPRLDPQYDPRLDPRFDPQYDPRLDPRFAEVGPQAQHPQQGPQPQGDVRAQPHAGGEADGPAGSPWFHAQRLPERSQPGQAQAPAPEPEPAPDRPRIPTGPERDRPLGVGAGPNGANGANGGVNGSGPLPFPGQRTEEYAPEPEPEPEPVDPTLNLPDGVSLEEAYFAAYRQYVREKGEFPNARQFSRYLPTVYGGTAPEERTLVTAIRDMRYRFQSESDIEHIP